MACRELSSQESRLRQEAADQATELATSHAAAVATVEAEASAELSELKGKLLKEQQEVTILRQDLEATKAQLNQVTVQLTELQATVKAQALPSVSEAEGGAVELTGQATAITPADLTIPSGGLAREASAGVTSASKPSREEDSSTTCMIELRAEFASMVDAGSQAEFEMGFVEALTQVTIEQLAFKLTRWHQHSSIEKVSEQDQDQGGKNYHDANEQGALLQGWLEVCHAQSYYDRLVAQVSGFNRDHYSFQ